MMNRFFWESYSSISGKKAPIANGIRIPKVMQIWVRPPAGPLISTGATSLMYFGQKTEKLPVATPYKNLPKIKHVQFSIRVRLAPSITIKLVKIRHFHLPIEATGPEKSAPRAEPAVVID